MVVVMLATIAVKAQDIYVGGSLNVWRNSTGNTTSFKVAPEIGYNFNETWALGAELNYSHEYVKQVTANSVTVAPYIYNPQIQISAESETKRSIFREKDKTKRSKKESAQHSKSRNKSFVMTSVSAL